MNPSAFPSTATSALLDWFKASRRPLPWRREPRDPYRVWLSEVMLQQTRVAAMLPRYVAFVARFPTLEALARASLDEVVALFSGLGYYARARNLHAAARAAAALGGLPRSAAELEKLPGFGPYTAAAVASLAFGEQAALVDGNVARVLSRVLRIAGNAAEVRARAWELAPSLLPEGRAGEFNEAMMELGATVCTPRSPSCGACPLEGHCETRSQGDAHAFPAPKAERVRPVLEWAAAALTHSDGSVLLRRHCDGELFAGTWGLPFQETAGHTPRRSARVALDSCGAQAVALEKRGEVHQTLTHRELHVTLFAGPGDAAEREDLRFVAPAALGSVGLSSLARKCLRACGIEEPAPGAG
ncbi:MAG: A/G-specific adenine glycosylase [Myxococcales bacterium]